MWLTGFFNVINFFAQINKQGKWKKKHGHFWSGSHEADIYIVMFITAVGLDYLAPTG